MVHNFFVSMLLGLLRFLLILTFGIGMAAVWATGFIYSFHVYSGGIDAVPHGMGVIGVFLICLMTVVLALFCIAMLVGFYFTSKAAIEMLAE